MNEREHGGRMPRRLTRLESGRPYLKTRREVSLASILIIQLNPPSLVPTTFKSEPSPEASEIALNVLTILLQTSLSAFSQPGTMVSYPDVVQAFFGLMESVRLGGDQVIMSVLT